MLSDQTVNINGSGQVNDEDEIRDIHALTPTVGPNRARRTETWETSSHRSSSLSTTSEGASSENFSSMSREFNALVIAGSTIGNNNNSASENDGGGNHGINNYNNLTRIGEEEVPEETNPLAIVPDNNPLDPVPSPGRRAVVGSSSNINRVDQVTMQQVKRDEIESKISAWQTAKMSKINNRFKREDAIINGWESEQAQKATSWMKKVERKLEEKRVKALEKMQNDIAKARRKAEERRASAEAKRGTKAARVIEIANLMRTLGRAPAKRSVF